MLKPNRNIQVLRGLAVIGVISFHAFPKIFKNGFLGVDIFFVISGFVIAPILNDIKLNKLTLREFFLRRYWRLAPALIFTLLISLPILTLLGGIGYLKNIFLQSLYALLSVSNISSFYFLGDYFRPNQNPLIHTWSLSIEQQIYFFTPIAILIVSRVRKNFKIHFFYFGSGLISAIISFQVYFYNETMNFYSPIYRYSQFCLGALIYYYSFKNFRNKIMNSSINSTVLISVIFLMLIFGSRNFIYVALIMVLFHKQLFINQLQNHKIMNYLESVGNKSYSLYLVHSPILWIVTHSPVLDLVGINQENYGMIVFGLLLTWISGTWLNINVENRFRRFNNINFKHFVPVLTAFFMALTGILVSDEKFYLTQTVLNRPINQMDPGFINCSIMNSDNVCKLSDGKLKKFLIIGDSHAGSISSTILRNASRYGSVDSFLRSGCQYVNQNFLKDSQFNSDFQSCYGYSANVERVVNEGNYDFVIAHYRSSTLNPMNKGSWKSYSKIKIESLQELVNTHKINVLLLGPTPEFPKNPQFFDNRRLLLQGNENPTKVVLKQDMNTVPFLENDYYQRLIESSLSTVKYLDLMTSYCNYKACSRWDNGWLYSDTDHLSALGAEKSSKKLQAFFEQNWFNK